MIEAPPTQVVNWGQIWRRWFSRIHEDYFSNQGGTINGDVNINGNFRLDDTAWDDLRFPANTISIFGFGTDPNVDTNSGTYLFDASITETLFGVAQMPHAWSEGTTIKPHVHWQKTTSAAGNVLWQLDYEVVNNGDTALMTYASSISNSTVASGTPDNDTANEVLITNIGDISMTNKTLSCLVLWKLSRIGGNAADTYGADARLLEFDIHYEVDSLGSNTEFNKDG